jgi:hypothetical protein
VTTNPPTDEMAASLKRDGFHPDEIANMLGPDFEAQPTPLRWGLDDVMWGDDDSVIVMLSGPDGEPYWLELDQERAAVLRQNLAGPEAAREVVHACPPRGAGLTPCCWRTPFELLRTDRMSADPAAVTCRPASPAL